ncbi:MAG: biopolymer transporter ExbD [Nannocystaceae bacterium]
MAGNAEGAGRRRAPIAAINITPFVDVMLVLLVIMMVSATHIVSQTMKVDLPKSSTSDGGAATSAAVTITSDHTLYFNKEKIDESELSARLRGLVAGAPDLTLMVSADAKAEHGQVVRVLDLARTEGVTNFAVNVERRAE